MAKTIFKYICLISLMIVIFACYQGTTGISIGDSSFNEPCSDITNKSKDKDRIPPDEDERDSMNKNGGNTDQNRIMYPTPPIKSPDEELATLRNITLITVIVMFVLLLVMTVLAVMAGRR